jgi:hypothetical protein
MLGRVGAKFQQAAFAPPLFHLKRDAAGALGALAADLYRDRARRARGAPNRRR